MKTARYYPTADDTYLYTLATAEATAAAAAAAAQSIIDLETAFLQAYPVGCIFVNTDSTATNFIDEHGTTWVWWGNVIVGVNNCWGWKRTA